MKKAKRQGRKPTVEKPIGEPIAIIGMACRLPGKSDTPEMFWRNLQEGRDAVTEIPRDRWNADDYYDPNPDAPGKCVTRRGAFLERVDGLDANFWGIPPRTAKLIDPQHRILCEVAWEAIENAGLSVSSLNRSDTGVFVGLWGVDYWQRVMSRDYSTFNGYEWSGNMHSSVSGYLSYFLGFTGPCMSVDTACSTSLVATHLACRHLQLGECD
ncbi:MAG: beta-ketoacyl synthase N-terminal-like domain-containing protein, partial [Vicinamibacteria bacterium]